MMTAEHLVLKCELSMRGARYRTHYHDDLGGDLQRVLETLEQEGWEVVTAFADSGGYPTIILKRTPR